MVETEKNGMATHTFFPEPDAPEFAPMLADLSRLYLRHRLDLGMAAASDEWIVAHTDDITATLWFLTQHAIDHGDVGWLTRHYFWLQAAVRLHRGEPSTPLDG